ncbi:MAG: hypothetical protein ABSB82_24545 [Terriglobia bacterium]|jgi:hypothetical protein
MRWAPQDFGLYEKFQALQKIESVGQNATLFPKSQISANFIFAQPYYLQRIKKLVSKVSKVSIVTFGGAWRSLFTYVANLSAVLHWRLSGCTQTARTPKL